MISEGRGHSIKFLNQVVSAQTLAGWHRYGHTPNHGLLPLPLHRHHGPAQVHVSSQGATQPPPVSPRHKAECRSRKDPPRPSPTLHIHSLTDPFGTHTNYTHASEVLSLSPVSVGGQRAAVQRVQQMPIWGLHFLSVKCVCVGGLGWGAELPGAGVHMSVRVPAGEAQNPP